ncbi:MAG: YcaO-like family protein [Desulfovibrionaceae bacterium]|nr:YcaO-like family protein [Desulfovibrionaceae bacterium]
MIRLQACPKQYTQDLDKAISPEETSQRVQAKLAASGLDVLATVRRVDVGRLGIPVYLSVCGKDARRIMPTRKQMGKGSSAEQARASAMMELMERYAFFSFWESMPDMVYATWSEAEARFGKELLPLAEITKSVNDALPLEKARQAMDLVRWHFYPATCLGTGKRTWLPLDWFKLLSEFNGTSAGNTQEESLLQGVCELLERHTCCLIDRARPAVPTIDPASIADPVLCDLLHKFTAQGLHIVLKDFSCGMPAPTVGAVAWDESTFPERSEIVFTAGTAATPAKAAIRAVTEVAQLGGDFCTSACYEASGLPKFQQLEDIQWLLCGESLPLSSLPSVESNDICQELLAVVAGLEAQGYSTYAVQTTHPMLEIPAHYTIIPGMAFRERDKNQSVGLFVGRKLTEEANADAAQAGLAVLAACYPQGHFIPFFEGMLALRAEEFDNARACFLRAAPVQPEEEAQALAFFYAGYTYTLQEQWAQAQPLLEQAFALCPEMKEYGNLNGVALFKMQRYAEAAQVFEAVLKIDKGSVMDIANLGLCYSHLGKNEAARHHLQAALAIDPTLEFASRALAAL